MVRSCVRLYHVEEAFVSRKVLDVKVPRYHEQRRVPSVLRYLVQTYVKSERVLVTFKLSVLVVLM